MNAAEPIRVLIAEDVATDAELSARELKRAGMPVTSRVAATAQGFRAALGEFVPHVILSDFTMPQFDGMAALRMARELAPDIPFIFVSGTLGEEYAIRALKNGATDYVLKTNLMRLPAAVERALAEARERRAKRETEQALQSTRELLASMSATLPDVLWSVSLPDQRVLYMSAATAAVYGQPPESFLADGNLWREAIHPEDRSAVGHAWQAFLAGGAYDIEYRLVRPGGVVCWVNDRARLLRDAAGVATRADGLVRDITEQVEQRQRLARLARVRELLGATNAAIVRLRGRNELFAEFCRIAVDIGGFVGGRVVELEPGTGRLRIAITTSDHDAFAQVIEAYERDSQASQSLTAEALRSGRPVVSNDVAADPRSALRDWYHRNGVRSVGCFPLLVGNRAEAALVVFAGDRNAFDEAELRLLSELASNLSLALERARQQERIDYLAYYDSLTGLPNRKLFYERLSQALVSARDTGRKVALVVFDIKRFKAINESLGMAAGDRVLQDFAQRIAALAGEHHHCARLGGNEFGLLLPLVGDSQEVGRLLNHDAASLLDTMITFEGRELRLASWAGVALHPEDGTDADVLLRNAEAALKKASAGSERYVFYAPSLNARVAERLDLESRLRRAVDRREFALHFQPKVDLDDRRLHGVEALLRWPGAAPEMASPARFIPVLEESGLIEELGAWLMREAVATYESWRARGLPAPRIAINVSAAQLRSLDFVNGVRKALGDAVGDDCGLDLEITESLLMANIEESLATLRQVRRLGVRIALDDFGTGYSSLAYLSKLPIDTLKIDRGFIRGITENPDDTTIVAAMISLGKSLRLRTVAEGVETEEQARLLKLLRCDEMQGYLFSKPVPREDLEALLAPETA